MTDTGQYLLPTSRERRFYFESEDDKENLPPENYLALPNKMALTPRSMAPSPDNDTPAQETVPISGDEGNPGADVRHGSASLLPVAQSSSTSPLPALGSVTNETYPQGKYFGIPVGSRVDECRSSSESSKDAAAEKEEQPKISSAGMPIELSTDIVHGPSDTSSGLSCSAITNSLMSLRNSPKYAQGATQGSLISERHQPENTSPKRAAAELSEWHSDRIPWNYIWAEYTSTGVKVIRGGFGPPPAKEKLHEQKTINQFFHQFPPPSNKDYEYTTDARDPRFIYKPKVRARASGLATFGASTNTMDESPDNSSILTPIDPSDTSTDEMWRDRARKLLGLALPEDATALDREAVYLAACSDIEPHLGHCWRCDTVHIVFGFLETLPGRDTCGAYLPSWFPAKDYESPWKEFIKIYKEIILLQDSGITPKSINKHPNAWGFVYHTEDPKWIPIRGESSGYWKCNRGAHALDVEHNCEACHKNRLPVEPHPHETAYMVKKDALTEWVHKVNKCLGVNDRQVAEAIVLCALSFDQILKFPYDASMYSHVTLKRRPVDGYLYSDTEHMDSDPGFNEPLDYRSYTEASPLGKEREMLDTMSKEKCPFAFDTSPMDLRTYPTMMQENYNPNATGGGYDLLRYGTVHQPGKPTRRKYLSEQILEEDLEAEAIAREMAAREVSVRDHEALVRNTLKMAEEEELGSVLGFLARSDSALAELLHANNALGSDEDDDDHEVDFGSSPDSDSSSDVGYRTQHGVEMPELFSTTGVDGDATDTLENDEDGGDDGDSEGDEDHSTDLRLSSQSDSGLDFDTLAHTGPTMTAPTPDRTGVRERTVSGLEQYVSELEELFPPGNLGSIRLARPGRQME